MTASGQDKSGQKAALRISLEPNQKDEFGKLADKYHNGNRSALIRHAVYLYRRIMDTPGEIPSPNQIKSLLDEIESDIEGMGSKLEDITDEDPEVDHAPPVGETKPNRKSDKSPTALSKDPEVGKSIQGVLTEEYPDPCSLSTLVSRTGYSEFEVCRRLEQFVTRGIVKEVESDGDRFLYRSSIDDAFGVSA